MTATVARLVLAMLLLPATGAVFIFSMLIVATRNTGGPPPVHLLLVLWAVVYAFIAAYWLLLWRGVVLWNPWRIRWTVIASVAALVAGAALTLAVLILSRSQIPAGIATLIGGGTVPITWCLATVAIWRETKAERASRLALGSAAPVACPLCGYSLAGLREARCPECGSEFTLDQLLAAQQDVRTNVEP